MKEKFIGVYYRWKNRDSMLLKKSRVLVISYLNEKGNTILYNDYAPSLGEWIRCHQQSVILQVQEIDVPLYDQIVDLKKGKSPGVILNKMMVIPSVVPKVETTPVTVKK